MWFWGLKIFQVNFHWWDLGRRCFETERASQLRRYAGFAGLGEGQTLFICCIFLQCCHGRSSGLQSFLIPQQQNFAMGSLAQISSGAIRCSFNTRFWTRFRIYLVRFWRVPVQIPHEVPEGSGWGSGGLCAVPEGSVADTLWGSGGFRCRYLVRFRKFPVQVLGEVPEGYGADTWLASRGFWCRYVVRFWKFPVQLPDEVPEGL